MTEQTRSQKTPQSKLRQMLAKINQIPELRIALLSLIAATILTIATPNFSNPNNLRAMAAGMSTDAIIAIGMTMALVSGGFDLSVGSTVGFTGTIAALALMSLGAPVWVAILLGILAGALVGVVNGLLIAKLHINPLIATLGMLNIVLSLALVLTEGRPLSRSSLVNSLP